MIWKPHGGWAKHWIPLFVGRLVEKLMAGEGVVRLEDLLA